MIVLLLIKKYTYNGKNVEMATAMREKFDDKLNGTRIKDIEMKLTVNNCDKIVFLVENFGTRKIECILAVPEEGVTEFCVDGEGTDKKIYSYRCYFQRRLYFIQKYLHVLTAYPYACIRLRYL